MKLIKNAILSTAIFSMVFLPVAQGIAAEKHQQLISKSEIQAAFLKSGLNKSITVNEFYEKNKKIFPADSLNSIQEFVRLNGDQKMPEFEISSSKNTNGEDVPIVRISQNGELISAQIYGDPNVYAQFDGTQLSADDFINFKKLPEKIYAENERLRKKTDNSTSVKKTTFHYPEVSADTLKKMSAEQRAGYIINMRLLWNDARSVLSLAQNNDSAQMNHKNFLFQFFIEQTHAANNANLNQDCLVAGYVTEYSGKTCDQNKIKNKYAGDSLYKSAASFCASPQIACNPLVFGAPNGTPRCIVPGRNADFQMATHFEGPCERENHLGTKIKFLKDENKIQGRYDESNRLLDMDQINEQLKKDQTDQLIATKKFISGILQFQNKELSDAFNKGDFSNDLMIKLKEIRDNFNTEIDKAKKLCKSASDEKKIYSPNFWGACDQMQRRSIFIADYLSVSPGCKNKKQVQTESLKCLCDNSKETEVNPGATCTAIIKPEIKPDSKPEIKSEIKTEKEKPTEAVEKQKIDLKINAKNTEKTKNEEIPWYKKPTTWLLGALGLAAVVIVAKPLYTYKKTGLCSDGKPAPCQCNVGSESFCLSVGNSKQ